MFDKPVTIFSLWRYVLWIFVFCVVVAFSITQLSGEPISNSEGFIHRSQKSVLHLSFFISSRPFTTDFFYKIWGSDPYLVVVGQKILSVFCWTFLGLAISHILRNPFLAMLSLVTLSTAGLWWNVGGWANVMRSESLAFSFFALWYGCTVLLRETKSWRLFVLLCFVTVFFSFTRDNMPYFLFLFAMFTLVFAKSSDAVRKKQWLAYLAIVLIVAILQSVSAQIGKRHQFPLINVILQRILPYQDRVHFFQSRGMPVDAKFIETWKGQWASGHDWALFKDPKNKLFMDFTLYKGKYVYGLFLLTHPVYSIKSAWNDRISIFSLNKYSYTKAPPSNALVQISSWFWNFCAWLIKNLLPVIFIFSVLIVKHDDFPLIGMIGIVFNGFLIYHADAMEVERHSLIVLIVLSTVSVHLLFIYADRLVNKIKGLPIKNYFSIDLYLIFLRLSIFSRSHVLRGNAVWTLCVLPLENNHKQIRKNLIDKDGNQYIFFIPARGRKASKRHSHAKHGNEKFLCRTHDTKIIQRT
jgi:hypothetical protein